MTRILPPLLLLLCACSAGTQAQSQDQPDQGAPRARADWVTFEDTKPTNHPPAHFTAEVATTPERRKGLLSPTKQQVRLWVMEYPWVKTLDIPEGGVWDVAFMDVGGRVIDIHHGVSCPHTCQVTARFPAASIAVAEVGVLLSVKRFHQMRYNHEHHPRPR